MKEENIIKVFDSNGNISELNVLKVFFSEETNKTYIIYTDDELDENNKNKIWASVIKKNDYSIQLEDINDDKEWDIIDKFIEENL